MSGRSLNVAVGLFALLAIASCSGDKKSSQQPDPQAKPPTAPGLPTTEDLGEGEDEPSQDKIVIRAKFEGRPAAVKIEDEEGNLFSLTASLSRASFKPAFVDLDLSKAKKVRLLPVTFLYPALNGCQIGNFNFDRVAAGGTHPFTFSGHDGVGETSCQTFMDAIHDEGRLHLQFTDVPARDGGRRVHSVSIYIEL